ncbi:hypothetical protein, partial [Neisseria sp. oral taxon 020]
MNAKILFCSAASLLAAFPVSAAETQEGGAQESAVSGGQLETVRVQGRNRSTRTENRDSFTTSAMRT